MACGADGLELDVCITQDDQLVVTHDLVLSGNRAVRRSTAASLSLPKLGEVLALPSPPDFWIDIEAKTDPASGPAAHFAQLLAAAIRDADAGHRVLVRSFDHAVLRAFHALEPTIPLAALIEFDSDEWVAIARSANASLISPHFSGIDEPRVAAAHAAGIRVSAWTVNCPDDWTRLADLGIDALITDDPAAAVRFFDREPRTT